MKDFKKHIEGLIKYHRVGHGIALGVASCLLLILVATILIKCSNTEIDVSKKLPRLIVLFKRNRKYPRQRLMFQ